jgi:hypothetical protein
MGRWNRNVRVSMLPSIPSGKKKLKLWLLARLKLKLFIKHFQTVVCITARNFVSFGLTWRKK